MREPRQARLKILDRKALAEVIRQFLGDFGGSQYRANKETGVHQPLLSLLLKEKSGEMGLKQFHELSRVIGAERRDQFFKAFYPSGTIPRLVAYLEWMAAETVRLQEAPKEYWALPFEGPTRMAPNQWPYPQQLYDDDWAQVLEYWEQQCPASHKRFHREMDKLGIPPDRKQLAIRRIFAPLLDSRASAYVESDWEELSQKEFETFADAGIKREVILLQRSSPLPRLQQLVWQKTEDGAWLMPKGLKPHTKDGAASKPKKVAGQPKRTAPKSPAKSTPKGRKVGSKRGGGH